MSDLLLKQLIEMGFLESKCKQSLAATNNSGLQPAVDWLIAHADDRDGEEPRAAATSSQAEAPSADEDEEGFIVEPTANSLKCDDCGRLLRNTDAAQFHAHKTGHQNFSQSTEVVKPLTEEEKKVKLEELKAKLAAKRQERIAAEAQEQKEREKMRRITGQEITEAKEKQKALEMKRAFEQQKREKMEEKLARDRIRAQIEADKKARAERAEQEKALRSGKNSSSSSLVDATKSVAAAPVVQGNYTETRIQIRVPNGPALTQPFSADQPLQIVVDFLTNQKGFRPGYFTLSTTFPRKTFTVDEYEKTLKDLKMQKTGSHFTAL